MLKKIEQLEIKLNEMILKLLALWFRLMHWIFPQKCFDFIQKIKQVIKQTKSNLKNGLIHLGITFKEKSLQLIAKLKELRARFSLEVFTNKLKIRASHSKEYLLKTPLKTQVQFFTKHFEPRLISLSENIKKHSSTQLYIALTAMVMIMVGTYGVYHSSRDIIKKEFPYRAPASVQEYDERPDYKMYARKTVIFFNMKLPITVENVADIDSITIDISVRTSTRWARFYLQEYEYKLKDYFFTTVEPVVSDFPLEGEGKEILKEKIRVEINNFLREHGVEGEVEDVRLVFIVAS